jgi:hypothetical protein
MSHGTKERNPRLRISLPLKCSLTSYTGAFFAGGGPQCERSFELCKLRQRGEIVAKTVYLLIVNVYEMSKG